MKFLTPYRIGVSVLLAAAAAMLYVGFTSSVDHTTQDTTRDQRVETVQPDPAGTALRQSRIFAQLAKGYTGVLVVDGSEIPEDQLDRREGLNTVGYTPGPGTETGSLKPGQRCAVVVYWPATSTREASSQTYRWCWQVH
jgi:hypothetical protein